MQSARRSLVLVFACLGVGVSGCGDPIVEADTNSGTDTGGDGDGDPGDGDGAPGDGDGAPGDGDGAPGDGDGAPGDGDGAPGDGDGAPAECGNGSVEGDEACDDGNAVDDDECTNACALPACGDGIVSAGAGETCDDGNAVGGDGCTATCVLPGAMILDGLVDINDSSNEDIGHEVVVDSLGNIDVLVGTGSNYRLIEYDDAFTQVWNVQALVVVNWTLAIGPEDELLLGGRTGTQGALRKYNSEGALVWNRNMSELNSWIYSVTVDGNGWAIGAGFFPDGNANHAFAFAYDAGGTEQWTLIADGGGAYGPITSDAAGDFWLVREDPRSLAAYAADQTPIWTNDGLPDQSFQELAVDDNGFVYLLANAGDLSMFHLHKFDDTGDLMWTSDHDDADVLDGASGLTLLPGGAILVAGFTNGSVDEADGLLSWYDIDGNLIHEQVIDGNAATDLDVFNDVAVGPTGDYAVAVGQHAAMGDDSDLWLYKFEI